MEKGARRLQAKLGPVLVGSSVPSLQCTAAINSPSVSFSNGVCSDIAVRVLTTVEVRSGKVAR